MVASIAVPPGSVPYASAFALQQAYDVGQRGRARRALGWIGSWFRWLFPPIDQAPCTFTLASVPKRLVCSSLSTTAAAWGISLVAAAPERLDCTVVVLIGGALSSYEWAFAAPPDDVQRRNVYLIDVAIDSNAVGCDARVFVHLLIGDAGACPTTRIPRTPTGNAWEIDAHVYEGTTANCVIHDVLKAMSTDFPV